MTEAAVTDAESRLPSWADEIRHPSPGTVEYRRAIGQVLSSNGEQPTVVGLAQDGPGAPVEIVVGDARFSLSEAMDLTADALWAVRIVQRITLQGMAGS